MHGVQGSFEEGKADESNGFVFPQTWSIQPAAFPPALWIKSSPKQCV